MDGLSGYSCLFVAVCGTVSVTLDSTKSGVRVGDDDRLIRENQVHFLFYQTLPLTELETRQKTKLERFSWVLLPRLLLMTAISSERSYCDG